MKKYLISAFVVLAVAISGVPYYLGVKAEESLKQQTALLEQSGWLAIESHRYERGWFSSTETTVLRVKPALLQNVRHYLPDNLKTVLQEPVTLINHIKHGPIAGGFGTRAYIETELVYRPETAKVLARFFGEQIPLNIRNTIYLNGSGKMDIAVPAFDYEELSGIRLNWKGLEGSTSYQSGFGQYQHQYHTPGVQIKLADKGDIAAEGLSFQTETFESSSGLALGKSKVMLDKFFLQWKEGVDYNIRLNELLNLLGNLQIGAFINPTGTVAPSKIEVSKLQFETQTDEKNQFIDSEGLFSFQTLNYGEDTYGPLAVDIAAEHLDPKGLKALKNKLAEIVDKEMTEEQIRSELLKTAKTEASGLFTQNPVFSIKAFKFKMPQGLVDVNGRLTFKQLQQKDLDSLSEMLKKTEADFHIRVPQTLLEQLTINQARNIFSINPEDEEAGRTSIEDINETLRLMVDSTVRSMAAEQYLDVVDGNISTRLTFGNSSLKLNGKVLQGAEEDMSDKDMPQEAAASEGKQQ